MALLSEIARRQRAHAGQQILAVGVLDMQFGVRSLSETDVRYSFQGHRGSETSGYNLA